MKNKSKQKVVKCRVKTFMKPNMFYGNVIWLEEMNYLKGKIAKVIGTTKGNYLLDVGTYTGKGGERHTCYEFSKEMLDFM